MVAFYLIPNGIPGSRVFLFCNQLVKIAENKFNVFVLVLELLLDLFDFEFNGQVIAKHLPDAGKNPHNLNVDIDCLFAVQNT